MRKMVTAMLIYLTLHLSKNKICKQWHIFCFSLIKRTSCLKFSKVEDMSYAHYYLLWLRQTFVIFIGKRTKIDHVTSNRQQKRSTEIIKLFVNKSLSGSSVKKKLTAFYSMRIGMQGKNVKEIWKLALLLSIVYREK